MKCQTVDGNPYIDTSCLLVMRPAFQHLIAWVLQTPDRATRADQYLWSTFRGSGVPMAFVDRPTVAYQTLHRQHYQMAGEAPPPDAISDSARSDLTPRHAANPTLSVWATNPVPGETASQPVPGPAVSRPFPAQGGPSTVPAITRGDAIAQPSDGTEIQHGALIDPLFNLPALLPNSAWSGHIPFLFALFRMLRPATFVELGVHTGASLIAAASAAAAYKVPTQLVGIDTFMGDEHAGQYDGDELYNALRLYLSRTFPSVRLERSYFADVLPRVPPGSIDILHIDGLHTYEAVLDDFTSWFDRVSPTGIILMHDISVRERGFGVHLLWDELKSRLTTLEFPHSHGLGVILMSPEDERVRPLTALARDERAMQSYRNLVAEMGRSLPERMAARG